MLHRGERLRSPKNYTDGTNKDAKIYVGRSNQPVQFWLHMNYSHKGNASINLLLAQTEETVIVFPALNTKMRAKTNNKKVCQAS